MMNQQQHSFLEGVIQGSLFTYYFLGTGVQQTPEYQQSDDQALTALLEEFQERYLALHAAQSPDEADTEDELIEPILDRLGFQARSRQKTSRQATGDRPDFLLFADAESKRKAQHDRANQYQYGVAILEAKRFGRPLDKRGGDSLDRGTPSNQILRYLSVVEPASNGKILWGILTNGRLWRLYYHKAKSRTDGYIEFDLDPLFNPQSLFRLTLEERLEAFKLFYLFFCRDAFVPTVERPSQTFLQFALEEGKNYEERVTEDLKQKIFEDVFIWLACGFVEDAQQKNAQITQEFLDEVYKNVLTLLYRLLFILYAEDRDLLPVRDDRYDDYSLRKIRDEIERKIDERDSFSQRATSYWDRLKALFRMINSGDPSINVPVYNGGLFDPQAHPFLEQCAISDFWLARALDLLSRDHEDPDHPRRINYRDLGVRQLGSIYEGLLEFKLRIAEEDLVVVKDKDGEHYLPKAKAGQKRILAEIKQGELFITNDKSERKATGSYYTPDYIVQYIVENTLGPLVQRIEEEFERKREELKAKRKLSARAKTVELAERYDPAVNVLELKVLDPAMGSGHFLVAAVDFLADRINSLLEKHNGQKYFGDELYESPLYRQIEEVRQKIRESAAQQRIELDESKLEDKHIIKRMVMKRCIYGVDVNEMAVELAKVSLWLHSFTVGAPLSFLDHHLKCGNSLIGVFDASDVIAESSPRYREFLQALHNMILVGQLTDVTLAETQKSARLFEEAKGWLEPFRRRLDVSLAIEHFMELTRNQRLMVQTAISEGEWMKPEIQSLLAQALEIARQKRFFHWKLEFPEVWYTERGPRANPGFDAVIGNPPYGAEFDPLDLEYLRSYLSHNKMNMNSAMLFIEQGLRIKNKKGFFSHIIPKSLAFSQKWAGGRRLIMNHLVVTCDASKAFEDVLLEQMIIVVSEDLASQKSYKSSVLTEEGERCICYVPRFLSQVTDSLLFGLTAAELAILEKMTMSRFFMRDISKTVRGLPLQKYVVEGSSGAAIYRGDQIARFSLSSTSYTILPKFLEQVEDKVAFLKQEKVMSQRIVAHVLQPIDHIILMAVSDHEKVLTLDTIENTILTAPKYSVDFVTALFNSRLFSWYAYWFIFAKAIRTMDFDDYYVGKLPIRRIFFTTPEAERKAQVEELKRLYNEGLKQTES